MKTPRKLAALLIAAAAATVSAPAFAAPAFADCSDARLSAMMAQKSEWLVAAPPQQILAAAEVAERLAAAGTDQAELCRLYGEILDALAPLPPQLAETP